ncbi:MAG: DinB family protein [Terriglobales bacterium]
MDAYLERLRQELENALAGTTPAGLAKGPAGKWNSGQILEHLYLTYKNTNKGIARCLEKGAPLVTRATLRHRLATLLVVDLEYLPGGNKAPERARPQGMSPDEALAAIFPEIRQMDSGLAECERKFGANTKIMDHPILGPLSAKRWRRFHLVHGRHHARQIRQRLGRA